MNIKEFDQLLKRVNLEEDINIKYELLSVINKYMDVISGDVASTPPFTGEENIDEEYATHVQEGADLVEEEAVEEENSSTEKEIQTIVSDLDKPEDVEVEEEAPIPSSLVSKVEAIESNDDELVKSPEPVVKKTNDEIEKEQEVYSKETSASLESKVEPEEVPVSELNANDKTVDSDKTYKEVFGLPSTTKEEHLQDIITNGGVMFREKRSFYLMLALEDEIIALGRTQKLEEFPQDIQEHLKEGGFLNIDVLEYAETEKTAKRRYVEVEFTNLRKLDEDHWIIQNVNNLLENGEVPERIKKQQDQKEEQESENEKAEPVNDVVKTEQKNEEDKEAPVLEKESLDTKTKDFLMNPDHMKTFKEKKDEVTKHDYLLVYKEGKAQLMAQAGDKLALLGLMVDPDMENCTVDASIVDYEIRLEEDKYYATIEYTVSQGDEEKTLEDEKMKDESEFSKESPTKEYDQNATDLIKPTGDYQKGKEELLDKDKKDIGVASEQISKDGNIPPNSGDEVIQKANNSLSESIAKTSKDTGIQTVVEEQRSPSTTTVMGNLKEEAGQLTETETVVDFHTMYQPESWAGSVGKTVQIQSELVFNNGETFKNVSIIGKNGLVIAQGQVPINNALFLDGNKHSVEIGGFKGSTQYQNGFGVSLLLTNFTKVA